MVPLKPHSLSLVWEVGHPTFPLDRDPQLRNPLQKSSLSSLTTQSFPITYFEVSPLVSKTQLGHLVSITSWCLNEDSHLNISCYTGIFKNLPPPCSPVIPFERSYEIAISNTIGVDRYWRYLSTIDRYWRYLSTIDRYCR